MDHLEKIRKQQERITHLAKLVEMCRLSAHALYLLEVGPCAPRVKSSSEYTIHSMGVKADVMLAKPGKVGMQSVKLEKLSEQLAFTIEEAIVNAHRITIEECTKEIKAIVQELMDMAHQ